MNRRTANVRAHGFTTLYVLFKEDLTAALGDYPEDRALLARKAQKAAKEVAAKHVANVTAVSTMKKDIIVPLSKDPVMVTALLKLVPKNSNIAKWLNYGSMKKAEDQEDQEDTLVVEKTEHYRASPK